MTSSLLYPRSAHPKLFSSKLAKKYNLSVVYPSFAAEKQIILICSKSGSMCLAYFIMKMFMEFNKIVRVDVNIPKLTSTVISCFHVN